MSAPQTLPSRLIGALFVERGLVSESQIRVALEIQRETGQQLGQVLVERFGVSRKELASVVAEQWAKLGGSSGPEDSASWRRLGDIFVERGFVSQEELDEALARQRQTGERLGEALVAQGVISKFELAGALAEQMAALGETAPETQAAVPQAPATVHQLPTRDDPPAYGATAPDNVVELAAATEATVEVESEPDVPLVDTEVAVVAAPEPVLEPEPDVPAVGAEVAAAVVVAPESVLEPEPDVLSIGAEVAVVAAPESVLEPEPDVSSVDTEVAVVAAPEPVLEPERQSIEAIEPSADPVIGAVDTAEAPAEAQPEAEVQPAETVEEAVAEANVEVGEPEPVEPLPAALREAIFANGSQTEIEDAPPEPAAACFAFAPTTEGYRLVALPALPEPGQTIEIPEVGECLVLRVGPGSIPGDDVLYAFVEEPVTLPAELAVH